MPFKVFLGEWARMNDQWARFRSLLDSPSRVLETPVGPYTVSAWILHRRTQSEAKDSSGNGIRPRPCEKPR